jgi:hypothetical protein
VLREIRFVEPFVVAKRQYGAILGLTCSRNFFAGNKVFRKMPLHRDIFWVGRQWAVTGYGIQAVNQKRHSDFDIEASRIWDDVLLQNLRVQEWFNREDFDRGLTVARARYPQRKQAVPLQEAVPLLKPVAGAGPRKAEHNPTPQATSKFDLRIERWPAQFTSLWRVRVKR